MLTITSKLIPDYKIKRRCYDNPLIHKLPKKCFIKPDTLVPHILQDKIDNKNENFFYKAGPMKKIAYNIDKSNLKIAILNAGGLCPGLNNVIYDLVYSLENLYNVDNIYGVKNGYSGFLKHNMIKLNIDNIEGIQHDSGSILGTSRGKLDVNKIASTIIDHKINQLYIIGGDGTHRGAYELCKYFFEYSSSYDLSVMCIPKTIDNDIPIIDKSFGYETAVDKAKYAIMSAYTEAKDTEHGLGIVKLMGRSCGWIALAASLASYNVDICLIPEYEFNIDKVDKYIEHVMNEKDYCVIVVAEGVKIGDSEDDIGIFLKTRYENDYCVKYIDPTYQIRALPANTSDSIYCKLLAQSAVHAVMNGYSESTIGLVNNKLCVIPLDEIVNETNFVPELMWFRLLQSTLQPSFL